MHKEPNRSLKLVALTPFALGALAIAMPAGAYAQGVSQGSQEANTAPADDDVIIVTGIRASLENALAQKRTADVILDGISADDIGNVPDLDLGEALVRIPGVQLDREAERRGSSISVRGLPASFTKTTVMGQNIASPSASRFRVNPFGAFDSSIFSGANVIKSFTSDIQSGGLGANVDLRIAPALSRKDGQYTVRLETGYEDLDESFTPGFFASGSEHLFGKRLGIFGTVAYSKQEFRRDIFTINTYTNLIPAPTTANPTGQYSSTNAALQAQLRALDPDPLTPNDYSVLIPQNMRQFSEVSKGDRLSAAAGMEWEVTEHLSFRTDGIFTRRELDENQLDTFGVNLPPTGSAASVRTPVGDPVFAGDFDTITGDDTGTEKLYYFPEVTFSNPSISAENRTFNFLEETYGIYPQLTYKKGKWEANLIGTYSEATNTFVQDQYVLRANNLSGAGNGITGTINTGSGDPGAYLLELNLPPNAFNFTGFPTGIVTGNGVTASFNSNRNAFLVAGGTQAVDRSLYALEFAATRDIDKGPFTAIKFGARYQYDDTMTRRQNNSAYGTRLENLTSDIQRPQVGQVSGQEFFGGEAPGYLQGDYLSLDIDAIRAALFPLDLARVPATTAPNFLSDYYQPTPLTSVSATNWQAERDNTEAYALAKFDLSDQYDLPVRGNFGVRYTRTELAGSLLPVIDGTGTVIQPQSAESTRSFEDYLPSVNVIVDLTRDLVLNAAYYETFEALDLTEFSPAPNAYSAVNSDTSDIDPDRVTVTVSSLDREPRTSKAFDLGLSWYNRKGSIVAVNYFRKDIQGSYQQQNVCPASVSAASPSLTSFNGLTVDASGLCITGAPSEVLVSNVPSTLPAGSEIIVRQFVTSPNTLELSGIEAQIQQNLSFLDNWMSGFGFVANYSHLDYNEPIYNVSDYTYNIIGYYETPLFAVRVASNTRGPNTLPGGGSFQGGEREVAGRTQIDASLRVRPRKNLDLRFEVFNITEVGREEYEYTEQIIRRTDYDGRSYGASIQYKF